LPIVAIPYINWQSALGKSDGNLESQLPAMVRPVVFWLHQAKDGAGG
jgi:hypothetical protein